MQMSLDTHDSRTCYADLSPTEDYNASRAEDYARRHNRQVVEVYRDGKFDRAFTVDLPLTVKP